MSTLSQVTTHELWVEGRGMTLTLTKPNPTTVRLTWTNPTDPSAFNGAIVVLSEERLLPANYPIDGTRYTPSSNWAAPADKIGDAQVVAAYYGIFGDSMMTTVDVSNVDPSKIYFASVHAASNVLQYYTTGVYSYPLESSRIEKSSDAYAGSIPTLAEPPVNPTNGQAYFDSSTNKVLVWSDVQSAWLATDPNTMGTGEKPPVGPNYLFFNQSDVGLKFLLNGQWVACNASNTRIRFGSGWVPLGNVSHETTFPETPSDGDVVLILEKAVYAAPAMGRLWVYTVGQWLELTDSLIQFNTGPSIWTNAVIASPSYAPTDPKVPGIGSFFYNTTLRDLLVWNGENWTKADTESEGTPITDKVGVGTDGSYDERLRLIRILKGQMGWPAVCVELEEEQFNIAIDNALDEFRRRADNAYVHRHILFTLKRGQQLYYLNDPRTKTDKIVNVIKIHRINLLGITTLSSENNIYAQTFFNQFYQGNMVDLTGIHLSYQMSEMFEKIFAGNLMFTWDEASRQLMIHRRMTLDEERVVLEVVVERTEQELLLDRWAKQWLQGWAHAELKEILGMIRSKYSSVAGPNGGLTLNGDLLISEARADFEELLRQITDYEAGNGGVNFGNTAFFIG